MYVAPEQVIGAPGRVGARRPAHLHARLRREPRRRRAGRARLRARLGARAPVPAPTATSPRPRSASWPRRCTAHAVRCFAAAATWDEGRLGARRGGVADGRAPGQARGARRDPSGLRHLRRAHRRSARTRSRRWYRDARTFTLHVRDDVQMRELGRGLLRDGSSVEGGARHVGAARRATPNSLEHVEHDVPSRRRGTGIVSAPVGPGTRPGRGGTTASPSSAPTRTSTSYARTRWCARDRTTTRRCAGRTPRRARAADDLARALVVVLARPIRRDRAHGHALAERAALVRAAVADREVLAADVEDADRAACDLDDAARPGRQLVDVADDDARHVRSAPTRPAPASGRRARRRCRAGCRAACRLGSCVGQRRGRASRSPSAGSRSRT